MAKITVTCNRNIFHSGSLYAPGSEITDEETSLAAAIASGAAQKKATAKKAEPAAKAKAKDKA